MSNNNEQRAIDPIVDTLSGIALSDTYIVFNHLATVFEKRKAIAKMMLDSRSIESFNEGKQAIDLCNEQIKNALFLL